MPILNSILGSNQDEDQPAQPAGGIMGAPTPASKAILDSTPHPLTVIPGSKAHEDGKMAYAQLIPKTTAPAGSLDWLHQRQEQLEFEKAHPYGAPISKHPGTFGTILHGLAKAGNIAGDILAPGTMANIPGTDMHRAAEQSGIQNQIERQGQIANQTTEAGAKQTEASAAVTRAGAEQENADTAKRNTEQPKPKEEKWDITKDWVDADNSPLRMEQNSGQLVRAVDGKPPTGVKPAPTAKPEKPDTPEQQFIDAEEKAGKTVQQAEKEYANLKPTQEPGNYLPINDAKGNTVGWVDPKSKHVVKVSELQGMAGEGGMSPGGVIPPKPTAQVRNVEAQAQVAVDGIPTVVAEIDKLKDQLGPVSGRRNQFMQCGVGMENPALAGLRADLLMVSSAVALAHARGRLPENLREEFDRAINAPKQDPENLKAVLNHILPWMQHMTNMTEPNSQPQTASSASATSGKKWNPIKGAYE
jgi:hypothetical protein